MPICRLQRDFDYDIIDGRAWLVSEITYEQWIMYLAMEQGADQIFLEDIDQPDGNRRTLARNRGYIEIGDFYVLLGLVVSNISLKNETKISQSGQ